MLQVNTYSEASKYGLAPVEVPRFLAELTAFTSICPEGFMNLAGDRTEVRRCFRVLRAERDQARNTAPQGGTRRHLSLGMSGDFELGIEEGATIVCVRQAVFGHADLAGLSLLADHDRHAGCADQYRALGASA